MTQPIVSIVCTTYNQARYIRDAVRGFVTQALPESLACEIIIHDDASTDGTSEILRQINEDYPDINVIFEEENIYSSPVNMMRDIIMPKVHGKYLAFCEGDDFWINPEKLAIQISYMETHPECALSVHSAVVVDEEDNRLGFMGLGNRDLDLTFDDISRNWCLPTASSLMRYEDAYDYYHSWDFDKPVGDFPRALFLATRGYVHYWANSASVYRFGISGSWTKTSEKSLAIKNDATIRWLAMLESIDSVTCRQHHAALVDNAMNKLIRFYSRNGFYPDSLGDLTADAVRSFSSKDRVIKTILRVFWIFGFELNRKSWSGLFQWRLVRHG